MSTIAETLGDAFESNGYDVGETSRNRDRIRIVLLTETADPDELEAITHDTLDEEAVLGWNVTTESIDGQDAVGTVVSFRHRS